MIARAKDGFGNPSYGLRTLLRPLLTIIAMAGVAASAQEPGIRDNSFLIEEAFNQEQGVVQHIFNAVPAWQWNRRHATMFDFLFTQEYPLGSQRHQLSYSLPMLYEFEQAPWKAQAEAQGFGDMLLNYRLQVLDGQGPGGWWASPRVSLIVPTGDENDGLGNGEVGYQFDLPLSKEFERLAIHLNAGMTTVPNVRGAPPLRHTLDGYNLGASAIYFLRPNFHLMLETAALWYEEIIDPTLLEDDTFECVVSPGFRLSLYTEGDTQWVIGASTAVGLSEDAPNVSLFLYMSFEHRIWPERP